MSRPRWTKVVRDLGAHKVRTMLVVLSIAVGIFAVAVMLGGRAVLLRALDETFPGSRPASITFYAQVIDDHVLRALEAEEDVDAAEGRRRMDMSFRRVGTSEWGDMTLVAYEDFDDVDINRIDDLGSSWPKRGEIVVEQGSAQWADVQVGDYLEFETSGERDPRLRVVGIVHDLNAVVPIMTASAVAYVDTETLPDLEQPERSNQVEIVASPRFKTQADLSRLAGRLRDEVLAGKGVVVASTVLHKPNVHYIADIFKAISLLLVVIGILTLLLSGFLVVNTVNSLMAQQTRQIGVMKAVGGRRGQLMVMYFLMVAAYGVAAVALAIPLGHLAQKAFVDFAITKLNFIVTDYVAPPGIIALELAVGILVPLLAAAVPVITGMRMPTRHALYSEGIKSDEFGEGLIDRTLAKIQGLPRPIALALRNTFIRKGRLVLTLTTLTLAAGVFISVASVRSSIGTTVERIGLHRAYDVVVHLRQDSPRGRAEREVLGVRGVSGVESWMEVSGIRIRPDRSESQNILIYGVPSRTTFFRPEIIAGRWLRPEDEDCIVVDSGFVKDEPDVEVGDTVEIQAQGVEKLWKVVGIVRGDFLNPFVYADRERLDSAMDSGGAIKTMVVRTDHGDVDFQTATGERVSDHLIEKGIAVSGTMSMEDLKATIADSLNIIVVFLVIMAALLVAVGGMGLSGTMSINVMESTREIGVMRAIGARSSSIYQIFIAEGVIVGVISWALGTVLAVPMSYALTYALGIAMSFPLTWAFSAEGVGAWLAFVILISVLASLLPAHRAASISVRESLAYE